jgi:hypothetical protein
MKTLATLLVLSFFASTSQATAQEYQGCWMVNPAGRFVSLSALCPQPAPLPSVSAQNSTPQLTDAEIPRLATYYAEKYCDYRETGVRSRDESRQYASDETDEFMELLWGTTQTTDFVVRSWGRVLDAADAEVQRICPGDA